MNGKDIERAVMADSNRPCLYGVAGPCQHPACLEAHFQTLRAEKETTNPVMSGIDRTTSGAIGYP